MTDFPVSRERFGSPVSRLAPRAILNVRKSLRGMLRVPFVTAIRNSTSLAYSSESLMPTFNEVISDIQKPFQFGTPSMSGHHGLMTVLFLIPVCKQTFVPHASLPFVWLVLGHEFHHRSWPVCACRCICLLLLGLGQENCKCWITVPSQRLQWLQWSSVIN